MFSQFKRVANEFESILNPIFLSRIAIWSRAGKIGLRKSFLNGYNVVIENAA